MRGNKGEAVDSVIMETPSREVLLMRSNPKDQKQSDGQTEKRVFS